MRGFKRTLEIVYVRTLDSYVGDQHNAGLPHTTFRVRQGANSKIAVFRGLLWILAVIRSDSLVCVDNAANFKKCFPCKTFGCDKNSVIRMSCLYIVKHYRILLNIMLNIHVHLRTLIKCMTKCRYIHDPLQNEKKGYWPIFFLQSHGMSVIPPQIVVYLQVLPFLA